MTALMSPLTDLELDAIEERLSATSPAPWRHRILGFIEAGDNPADVIGVTCQRHDASLAPLPGVENAEFIAHARQDVPRLVDEVRRLRERVAELESALCSANGNGLRYSLRHE